VKFKWKQCPRCAGRLLSVPGRKLCSKCLKDCGLKPYPTHFTIAQGGWVARGGDGKVGAGREHSEGSVRLD
jgi:hypothetical protein